MENLPAAESEDICQQFEHEETTEAQADTIQYVVNSLPLAVVEAFFAAMFTPKMIMSINPERMVYVGCVE